MKIAQPEVFALILPLVGVAWFAWRVGVRRRSRLDYPTGTWIQGRPKLTLISPFRLQFWLRLAALSFMLFALARPQEVFTKINRTVEAVDMVICFDLSKSMEAIDFRPNRHTVAINMINAFVDKRADDRIGIVLFSGEAFLAVPITHDHKVVKEAMSQSSNKYLRDGTAIGQSLAVAATHLKDSKAKSRVVILVTDGDNNMGNVDPITAAELAKAFGIKIYTIGMGKKGRVAFPVRQVDAFGREVTTYQYLTDALNDELLADIAKRTGALSFRAEDLGVLEKIFSEIDRMEKTKVETNTVVRFSELAWPWILGALLLLIAEGVALNTRWRKIP